MKPFVYPVFLFPLIKHQQTHPVTNHTTALSSAFWQWHIFIAVLHTNNHAEKESHYHTMFIIFNIGLCFPFKLHHAKQLTETVSSFWNTALSHTSNRQASTVVILTVHIFKTYSTTQTGRLLLLSTTPLLVLTATTQITLTQRTLAEIVTL